MTAPDEAALRSLAGLARDVSNASAGYASRPVSLLVATLAVLAKAGRRAADPEALTAIAAAAFGAELDGTRRWRSFVEVVLAGSVERGAAEGGRVVLLEGPYYDVDELYGAVGVRLGGEGPVVMVPARRGVLAEVAKSGRGRPCRVVLEWVAPVEAKP